MFGMSGFLAGRDVLRDDEDLVVVVEQDPT